MENEEKEPASAPVKSISRKTFFGTVKEWFFERYPESRPWIEYFGEKVSGIKKGYIVLIAFIGISGFLVWGTDSCVSSKYEDILSATNVFYSSSNTFMLGQYAESQNQLGTVEKKFDDYKHDADNQILNQKQDNANLTAQLGNANLRIDQLENLPSAALLAVSNAGVALQSFNNVGQELQMNLPNLVLWINDQPLTNYLYGPYYVLVVTNREIGIDVQHLQPNEIAIKELTIDCELSIDLTNIVSGINSSMWQQKGGAILGNSSSGVSYLEEIAQPVVNQGEGFHCTPLTISTNVQTPCIITMGLNLYAPGLRGAQNTTINLLLEK
jgi:hypothetical protein